MDSLKKLLYERRRELQNPKTDVDWRREFVIAIGMYDWLDEYKETFKKLDDIDFEIFVHDTIQHHIAFVVSGLIGYLNKPAPVTDAPVIPSSAPSPPPPSVAPSGQAIDLKPYIRGVLDIYQITGVSQNVSQTGTDAQFLGTLITNLRSELSRIMSSLSSLSNTRLQAS